MNENNEKNKKVLWFILLAFVALCIALLALFSPKRNLSSSITPNKDNAWDVTIDENAGEIVDKDYKELQEELNKKVAETSINISMNTNPTFENGKSEGNLMITNDESNRFMQIVEIIRDDTEEVIYTSKAIPVGKRIETAKLDVDLPKGSYDCTAYFNAIQDSGELVGKAAAKVVIEVKN